MEKTSQNAHKIHGSCGWRFFFDSVADLWKFSTNTEKRIPSFWKPNATPVAAD